MHAKGAGLVGCSRHDTTAGISAQRRERPDDVVRQRIDVFDRLVAPATPMTTGLPRNSG